MNTYPYRTYAEIDLNKMQHNLRQVRAAIGPDCKLLFVLKADAYGHGTPVCAKYSEELVDWYAVATIDEALSIRRAGVEKPILLFGALQDPEIELAADNRITINSCSLEYSRHVAEVLQRCGKRKDPYILVSFGLEAPLADPRVAAVVEPYPNRWTHHVPVGESDEVDDQLLAWIDWAHAFSKRKQKKG